MAYADEHFYTAEWGGSLITGKDIGIYLKRASNEIDTYTSRRIRKGLPEDAYAQERIQMAVCSVAELLYQFELADRQARQAIADAASKDISEKNIKSVSDGTESVTYVTGSEQASQAKALSPVFSASIAGRRKELYSTICRYLSGISDKDGIKLLYAGL